MGAKGFPSCILERMTRRTFFALSIAPALPAWGAGAKMQVYKTPTCGCCGKWVEHVRAAGFDVSVTEVPDTTEYRRKAGVPDDLQSCHTAVVNGYAVEGHVPAADIQRLVASRSKAKGLAVPGMPMGSPGMEGSRSDAYSVMLFSADGKASVYKSYPAK
jgi:hypothetical protein